jgi:hypothetical protein
VAAGGRRGVLVTGEANVCYPAIPLKLKHIKCNWGSSMTNSFVNKTITTADMIQDDVSIP